MMKTPVGLVTVTLSAAILLAASLSAVSPLALAGSVYYCWLLAIATVVFIAWPRRASRREPVSG